MYSLYTKVQKFLYTLFATDLNYDLWLQQKCTCYTVPCGYLEQHILVICGALFFTHFITLAMFHTAGEYEDLESLLHQTNYACYQASVSEPIIT